MISAKILLDSMSPSGCRLTTWELTYPRFIHSEFMTHRAISRNAASSRAIPIEKMIERVMTKPARPVWWGKNQSGMQAYEEVDEETQGAAILDWNAARNDAVKWARKLAALGLHKQIVNRVLEPWMHITVIATATDWENFFHLRCAEDAEPNFRALARQMRDLYRAGPLPSMSAVGEWHLPLTTPEDVQACGSGDAGAELLCKLSVGRCARVSYLTHDGKRDLQADFDLHDRLSTSGHWSPFEHVAQAREDQAYSGNFRGWTQYRKMFPTENFIEEEVSRRETEIV